MRGGGDRGRRRGATAPIGAGLCRILKRKQQTTKQNKTTHTEKGFLIWLPKRKSALTAEQLVQSNLPPQNKKKAVAQSQKAIPSHL